MSTRDSGMPAATALDVLGMRAERREREMRQSSFVYRHFRFFAPLSFVMMFGSVVGIFIVADDYQHDALGHQKLGALMITCAVGAFGFVFTLVRSGHNSAWAAWKSILRVVGALIAATIICGIVLDSLFD